MTICSVVNPYGSDALLVDKLIGNSYEVVKYVATQMEYIKHVSAHMAEVYRVSQSAEEIDLLVTNIAQIDLLLADINEILLVATNIVPVTAVGTNIAPILALNTNLAALLALYANLGDLLAVALTDGDKGDITVSGSGAAWAIDANVVNNAKLVDVATATLKGRLTAGTGDPEDLTADQGLTLLGLGRSTAPAGRLSLTAGVAVSEADVAAAANIYWVPSGGEHLPIYNGTNFVQRRAGELTLVLDGTNHPINKGFDVFAAVSGGNVFIGTGPAWTGDAVRGVGAATTELESYLGLPVNKNSITLINNNVPIVIPARQALCLGGFRTLVAGQARDTVAERMLSNMFNPVLRPFSRPITTPNWVYNGTGWQVSGGGAPTNGAYFHQAVSGRFLRMEAQGIVTVTDINARAYMGIGIDTNTVDSSQQRVLASMQSTSQVGANLSKFTGTAALGTHAIYGLEAVNPTAGTITWYGSSASFASGLFGEILI